jgi:flagellar hook-associated protein 1 FlgK
MSLQQQINSQLEVNINEVNSIAKEIAALNISIDVAESGGMYNANDLRDKRDLLELNLSKLIGADAIAGQLESNIQIDSSSNTKTGSYTININGFNLVDGNTYHPIHISKDNNQNGFFEISYERQDGTLIPMEESINGGRIGAILELRGGTLDTTSGVPVDGVLQNTISQLNAFATGLIDATNNLYAQVPTTNMQSNNVNFTGNSSLLSSGMDIKEGSFDIIVYDIDGNAVATRTININIATTMTGAAGSNSIEGQILAQQDDNSDLNATNDVDDFLNFNWASYLNGEYGVELGMDPLMEARGYTFAIKDNFKTDSYDTGTNFAGALGLNRFFDGNDARDINLSAPYRTNPTLLSAGATSIAGDNTVALNIMQSQFESYDFEIGSKSFNTTTYGMFDIIATNVGTVTNSAIFKNETISAQFNATQLEYSSVSKVSIDEEMTNLIKYQTSYGAAAKIITTIDQMMNTLLGIKQ